MAATQYVIWKRNDGVIGASCYMPTNYKTLAGDTVSFEHLKTFSEWDSDTLDFIANVKAQQAMLGAVVV